MFGLLLFSIRLPEKPSNDLKYHSMSSKKRSGRNITFAISISPYWVHVKPRIEFKILILLYKVMNDHVPSYHIGLTVTYIPTGFTWFSQDLEFITAQEQHQCRLLIIFLWPLTVDSVQHSMQSQRMGNSDRGFDTNHFVIL